MAGTVGGVVVGVSRTTHVVFVVSHDGRFRARRVARGSGAVGGIIEEATLVFG